MGQIYAVSATNHGRMPGGWFIDPILSGGGAVMDHTVHVVDLLRWLFGTEVKEVTSEFGRYLYDIPVEDCGLMMLTMENGLFASLDCSWSRPKSFPYWGDVTLRIAAEKGSLFLNVFDAKIIVASNHNGVNYENYGENFDTLLIEDFVETIKQGKKPLTSGEDGLEALRVALAAYQSGQNKETVIVKR
jgi:predicted dehydrogenase